MQRDTVYTMPAVKVCVCNQHSSLHCYVQFKFDGVLHNAGQEDVFEVSAAVTGHTELQLTVASTC